MPDREKLYELIDGFDALSTPTDGFRHHLADYLLANGVVVREWIPVTERLPEEHDSIFASLHGTKLWMPGMFRTVSDTVLVSIEREDGSRTVRAMHAQGGEWNLDSMPWAKKVTHWMPLPEPPKEDE